MDGLTISITTTITTIIISLFIAGLIKMMTVVLVRFSKPAPLTHSTTAIPVVSTPDEQVVDESEIAAAIAITQTL